MLRYTLVADGRSDRTLIAILDWLIEQHWDRSYQSNFAEHLPPLSSGLKHRIDVAFELYPCDILFVHRDSEAQPRGTRVEEISSAMPDRIGNYVPVVPVRMTEAWLLSNQQAIRDAAGNPKGRNALHLPNWRRWDRLPDPKTTLLEAIEHASGLTGRRLANFSARRHRLRVAELTMDFSPLRQLEAFRLLEDDIVEALAPERLASVLVE